MPARRDRLEAYLPQRELFRWLFQVGGVHKKSALTNQQLVQTNPVVCVPCTSIREDDLISGLKTIQDLNGIHGALAELYRSARRFRGAVDELEHADGVVLLSECRPAYVDNVIQMFELDGSVNAEIGPGAFRQRLVKGDFDIYSPLFHCGIHPRDMTVRDTVAGVDYRLLTDLNVLGLGLGNLDLGFQFCRIRNPREVISHLQSLPDMHGQLLQHARHAGAYMQRFNLIKLQFCELIRLIDCRLLGGQLRLDRIASERQPLRLDLVALLTFLFFDF